MANGKSEEGNDNLPSIKLSGNITKKDLQGPLKDKGISDLFSLMSNGSASVNIRTDKYPVGAIRCQISSGDIDMQEMWVAEDSSESSSKK